MLREEQADLSLSQVKRQSYVTNLNNKQCDDVVTLGLIDLGYKKTTKMMWSNNTRNGKIKGCQMEVFKILNGYENIDSNIFFSKIKAGTLSRLVQ